MKLHFSVQPALQKGIPEHNQNEGMCVCARKHQTGGPQETTKQAKKYAKCTESMKVIDRAFHYVSHAFSIHV